MLPLAQLLTGLMAAVTTGALAGWQTAPAVAVGAAVVAAGFAIFGWRTQGRPGVATPQLAFARLLVGTALKWLTIGAGLALAMSSGLFDPQFVLAGALSTFLAYLFCLPWLLR
ncbi:MAG TPA: hypothetical protein PKZ76_15470 [Xanthomonadaceae bacterium]|nr:hypothetical protein [Xanthomonadaceae bacterium]